MCNNCIKDRKDRWRNENPQRASRHDRAECDLLIVVAFEHCWQSDDAHGYHGCADHPDHRRQDGGGENGRRGEAAAQAAHPFVDDVKHFLDQTGTFEHRSHEDEQRDGGEIRVGHQGENPRRDDVHHGLAADQINVHDPQTTDDESHRQACHQQQRQ